MKCSKCQKNQAIEDPEYGVLPCMPCQDKELGFKKPKHYPEFTTLSIKEGRREYMADALQPFRDGVLSKEYVETYGKSGLSVPKEAYKNARYTMKHAKGWWNREKTIKDNRYIDPKV